MSLEDLQVFVSDQEKLSIRAESEKEDSPVIKQFGVYLDESFRGKHGQETGKNGARG